MSQEVQTEERVETEAVAQETAKTEKSGRKSVDILMVALNSISAVLLFIITGIPVLLLALAKFFEDFHNPFYVSETAKISDILKYALCVFMPTSWKNSLSTQVLTSLTPLSSEWKTTPE